MGTKLSDLHNEWSKEPDYKKAYDELGPQYALAQDLISARKDAGLSQAQVAERMGTRQSAISRIESGHNISLEKLREYAQAVGKQVTIEIA